MKSFFTIWTNTTNPFRDGHSGHPGLFGFCFMFLLAMILLPANRLAAQNDTPCECSQRWEKGVKWNLDGTVNDNPPNGQAPYGVVGCNGNPGTQPQIKVLYNCTYNPAQFLIDVESTNPCIDPLNVPSSPVNPTPGKPIIWFNFDTRGGAEHFMAQWNDNDAGDDIAWVLYYSNTHQAGTGAGPHFQSGDCDDLVKWSCGVESGNTFYMVSTPMPPSDVYNWYLAIWDQNGDDDLDVNNFKARFGCGSALPCLIVDCPDPAGATFECIPDIPAAATDEAGFEALGGDIMTNCTGSLSVTHSDLPTGDCAAGTLVVTRTYTITFTPNNGEPPLQETCSIVYAINDMTAPVLNGCPDPDGGSYQCLADVPSPAVVTASDNCGGNPQVTLGEQETNPGSSCNNTITRTWSTQDGCGNPASCTQTITVNDDTAPSFTCPPTVTIECDEDPLDLNLTGMVTDADDNCGLGTNTPQFTDDVSGLTGCNGTGNILRTWTLEDACGNDATSCIQTITVEDSTPPTPFDPADINNIACITSLPCPDPNDPVVASLIAQIEANSTDNCGGVTVGLESATAVTTCSDPDDDGIYTFGRTFTFSVADGCGNTVLVDVNVSGQCQPLCTFTQGAWGNAGGAPGTTVGMTDMQLIQMLITNYGLGKIRIGTTTNNRYLDITTAGCVIDLLPGGGSPAPLAALGCSKPKACAQCNPTGNDGSLKNNLANNTIALQLNIWFSQHNFDNNPNTNWNLGAEPLSCIPGFPADVLAKMGQMVPPFPPTVAGLLGFTNKFLGGEVGGVTNSFAGSLTNAVTKVNEYWHECSQPAGNCSSPLLVVSKLVEPTLHAWLESYKVGLRWFGFRSEGISRFVVERSSDDNQFVQVADLPPTGRENVEVYNAIDPNPAKGMNYYQLTVYLDNGEVETLPAVEVFVPVTKPYKLQPNPAAATSWLDFSLLANRKDVTVSLSNCYGQQVYTVQIDEVKETFFPLDLSELRNGLYLVTVKIDREVFTDKLIIADPNR